MIQVEKVTFHITLFFYIFNYLYSVLPSLLNKGQKINISYSYLK